MLTKADRIKTGLPNELFGNRSVNISNAKLITMENLQKDKKQLYSAQWTPPFSNGGRMEKFSSPNALMLRSLSTDLTVLFQVEPFSVNVQLGLPSACGSSTPPWCRNRFTFLLPSRSRRSSPLGPAGDANLALTRRPRLAAASTPRPPHPPRLLWVRCGVPRIQEVC
ncbi:Hypothetical predicted protein [Marmota monax]|uniref:Uncharacterized protein n=1 Tax=Marmota monax TaxID=9995 RepID=A0A5E4BZX2_MARMO|nr:Hypothetical predicted protein [Marmota monax]